MSAVAFIALAATGALVRYHGSLVLQRWSRVLPLGTLTVNVVGSLVLGLVVGGALTGSAATAVGVAGCGTLTTFSTFANETVRSGTRRGALNVAAHLVLGLGAAALGLGLA